MTFLENDTVTLSDMSEDIVDGAADVSAAQSKDTEDVDAKSDGEASPAQVGIPEGEENAPSDTEGEREEYERLIRTRFKDFYADDAQRMINKRFKRYKALEDRVRELESALRERDEASARFEAELESERERIERETEQRVINSFLANRHRPHENATATKVGSVTTDVSKLTRGERAALAQRALKGEKIAF